MQASDASTSPVKQTREVSFEPSLPRISVVTACFNNIRTIQETIESVLTQGYPSFEHVIVDGGSTDGTIELLKRYPHLKWISERDHGIYDAMNKGIRRCTGAVVGVLNSDDCYRPGALMHVGSAFNQHPGWDALFGDIVFIDGAGQEILRRKEAAYDYNVLRFTGICYVIHPTLFVKRSVYEELGYYRHPELLSCADYDLILKLGQRGYRVGHVPEFLANFRFHEYGQSSDMRVVANMHRENSRIMKEHGYPGGWLGAGLRFAFRAKRHLHRMVARGCWEWTPARSTLKKHLRPKGSFSTNMPVEKL